jgi:nucleotide-binding universal stress UspA family protein
MPRIQTILCPVDFSPHSDCAYGLAGSLARDYGARLVVLHVPQPPVVLFDDGGHPIPTPADYRAAAWQRLTELQPTGSSAAEEHLLGEGEAAASILRTAGKIKPDLIVMGTQGRGGVGRVLIGSVAEDVLRKAPCPVLTFKLPRQTPRGAS